ncbi:hypothetical protein [Ascidiimonas sp. W6]|uniref:hypothetical protein n=1 Tax=Ascidiimonas meishanensis TaxID=3128903 RepID=UPI0030EE7E38
MEENITGSNESEEQNSITSANNNDLDAQTIPDSLDENSINSVNDSGDEIMDAEVALAEELPPMTELRRENEPATIPSAMDEIGSRVTYLDYQDGELPEAVAITDDGDLIIPIADASIDEDIPRAEPVRADAVNFSDEVDMSASQDQNSINTTNDSDTEISNAEIIFTEEVTPVTDLSIESKSVTTQSTMGEIENRVDSQDADDLPVANAIIDDFNIRREVAITRHFNSEEAGLSMNSLNNLQDHLIAEKLNLANNGNSNETDFMRLTDTTNNMLDGLEAQESIGDNNSVDFSRFSIPSKPDGYVEGKSSKNKKPSDDKNKNNKNNKKGPKR